MQRLSSKQAPKAIGAYSTATQVDQLIFTSGQLGIDPATGGLVGEDIAAQTKQAMQNLQGILEDNQSSMAQVVKATVLLSDISDFAVFNQIYAGFFEENNYPSRTAFEVGALPMNARIEIEVIARVDS